MDPIVKYDVIVLGLGVMGTAVAAELSRRGRRVLGLDQFEPAHQFGSSHGETRVIRTAYYEHPAYVPIVRRSFRLWHELEQRSEKQLLCECPCLSIGQSESELITGVRQAAREHQLAVQELDAAALACQYPMFRFDDSYVGLLEHEAGFLLAERCVRALACDAIAHGAKLRWNHPVVSWKANDRGVSVRTTKHAFSADRLVIAAGAWATSALGSLGARLTVMRQTPVWLMPTDIRPFARDRFPVYLADTPEGCFYGLPIIDQKGHKVARHYGAAELSSPESINRTISDEDEQPVRNFIRSHLPSADGFRTYASVCLYTLSPDRHFVIDRHPDLPTVVIATGFSGHGFKFAPVVGEMVADLVDTTRPECPIELFRIKRLLNHSK